MLLRRSIRGLYSPRDTITWRMATAWLPVLLAIFALRHARDDSRLWIAICLGQILLLAVIGLMQAETARIWCFLLPLLMFPAGLELSRWPRPMQAMVLGMMWLLMCLVGINVRFMY